MPTSRKSLAQRADDRRTARASDRRVAELEDELAAVRQREQMYREAWHATARQRDRFYLAMHTYRRAARRRYLAMLRLAEWSRRGQDRAKGAQVLYLRYRERWDEALIDGERFKAERDQAREDLARERREGMERREELRAQLAMARGEGRTDG